MIEFSHVSKRYPTGHDALRDVNFSLGRGELAFLTGHSGAGKSTLLRLIMLMERPSSGTIQVAGQTLTQLKSAEIPFHRRRIGVVFQNHQLLFDRSVFDNIALPLHISGYHLDDIGKRVRAALDKVGLLSKEKLNPVTLSTGEQQRIGIARAIVNRPQLILADEPTGNLDPELSAEIMRLFMEFNHHGTTVLIASHDLALINQMDCRVLTLNQGRMTQHG
ncbi:cell division ATP-binding protein FtsE [Neptuniibacter sp. CAU 1671]|uniref:cell division ATP-binding protein FtsE n=1 Tax=Neptuniibacter sp. CAU 1671 TaxID=3032593 RepID=UPI0023DC1BDD|nr:cell division ATP-binding protein FtsE [Neptuniibacter sp. CAU 1671]MDF2182426.1 cell division ATP-binding protein FtsE [Neptuniibacter sp. CAU 1671]